MNKVAQTVHARIVPIAAIAGVALAGATILVASRAAGPFVAAEPEQGIITAPASSIADAAASGSAAVNFKTAQISGGFCDTFPSLPSAKPDATNTGVPAGTNLTAYTGPTTITTAGTVIDGKIITDQITIKANNVTIRNSKLGPGGFWAVQMHDNFTGTRILNNEIYAPNGAYTGIGISDGIVCGNHIHGYENGITVGGNMIIQANYIHGMEGDGSSDPHEDAIEVYSGSNSKIWGNTLLVNDSAGNWLGDTGAVNITTEWSNIDNVEVNGNWLGGGSYTLYVRESSASNAYRYSNIRITNNRWMGSAPKGFAAYGPMSDDGNISAFSGNVWDATGQPVIP